MKISPQIKAYIELTKPRILMSVLITTTIGYYLGTQGSLYPLSPFLYLLLGTFFMCSGSSVLNHYLEREFDSKMLRTQNRPLPAGIITPSKALNFGIILILIGLPLLYIKVNILTAFLSLLTSFLYIMVYTPMKRVSWLNTTVGAVPGAIPPLGGWAAATGTLNFDAGMLFLILFIWQHPHFYAIAWIFKEDYKRAGFKMLPCIDPNGARTMTQVKWFTLALIPISLNPVMTGISGWIYFVGVLLSGLALLYFAKIFTASRSVKDARNLLKATVMYMPVWLILIILDKIFV